jgi:hypothetical protein
MIYNLIFYIIKNCKKLYKINKINCDIQYKMNIFYLITFPFISNTSYFDENIALT